MAAANPYRDVKLLRNKSMDGRPDMAELRVVLLGNNWTQRCLVENLLVRPDPQWCRVKYHKLTVINLPDLLQSDLTEDRLTELVRHVADASSPGPHVFLLVLEPESFTEQHHRRLRSILEKYSEKSFDHVFVLLLTDQQEDLCTQQMLVERPHLKRFIEECRYSYQWIRHCEAEELNTFARAELVTRLTRIVKENSREYLKYKEFKDPVHPSLYETLGTKPTEDTTSQSLTPKVKKLGFAERPWKRSPEEFYFQMLLLGDGDKKKLKHKMISGKSSHPEQDIEDLKEWRGKKLKIVKSNDLFTISVPEVLDEMKRCMREFNQGPNVLLLRPSAFTEKNTETLWFIVSLFGPNALKHSILVFTDEQNKEPCENSLLRECKERYDKSTESIDQMMIKVEAMVEDNKGSFVSLTDVLTPKVKIEKNNFVFCGTHRSAKTRAISAILGPATCYAESSSECVKRQAEVSGRLVTIVELPALSTKPEREVLDECWSSVSMCEPEGVYAFVMVLPVASLTDEDKVEFQTIQKTFSSRINSSTVILFTVESDPKAQVFTDFVKHHEDIQLLCRSCRGYVFININDPQRAPQVLEEIEKIRDLCHGFTTETFAKIQFTRFTQTTSKESSLLERGKESEKTLRIVLIGKTGSGKSSSGNTILGRDAFKSDFGQDATTKCCQKEHSIMNSCRVEVVDTPGLFDRSISNQEIYEEMIKCISLLAPGPHVFLVVLGINRFTQEENETLNLIMTGFGKDAQKYIIVLFTHGEVLDKYKISIEDFIKNKCDRSCKKLISDCGNRYHVFNNDNESKRQQQVNELIQKINALVQENGGSCYTNKDLIEAESAIQRKVETLLKEREEEFEREKQEMEDKHKQEMQEIQQRMEEEREETERVKQEKDNERRQMEAKIIHERELRKKEQEIRDMEEQERIELDRVKQQEYEQKLKELEENLSQEVRDKMEKERQEWEEERKEYEKQYKEDKKRREEEQEQQEQEYKKKYGSLRKEKKELQLRREQEERERKELEEKHKQEMEDLIKSYEEEARRQAEELNEFKERKDSDFADMLDKHLEEVKRLKDELEQKQREYQSLQNLAAHNETELKSDMVEIKTDMENLQSLHKHQLIDLAIAALTKEKDNCKTIKEIQKKHASEIEKCKKEIKHEFERERRRKTESLKTKQSQETKDLAKNNNKDTLPQEKRKLSEKHKKELQDLHSDLWNQYKQQEKKKVDEKKKQHEEALSKTTDEFLRKNEEFLAKKSSDLEKKQKAEMEKLMKKAKGKVNEDELDQLETEHKIEMDKIKKTIFREKGKCHIL